MRHRDEFRHEQASDESVVAGGVRLVRLHDSAVYRHISAHEGDEPRYRAYQMLNASGLNIRRVLSAGGTDLHGAERGTAGHHAGYRQRHHRHSSIPDHHPFAAASGKPYQNLPMSLRIKNIALSAWFLLPLDERVREIVVLAAFAPVTIFSTKFTDSLTGNAKLAGFSLTVTAIIGLTFATILHAVLPVA